MSKYGVGFSVSSLLLSVVVQGQQVASVESTLLMSEPFKPSVSVVWSPTGQAAWDQLRKYHHVGKVAVEQTSPTATALDDFLWDAEKTLPPGCLNVAGEYTDAFAADLRRKLTKLIGKQAAAMIDPAPKLDQIKGTNRPIYRLQSAIMVSALVAKPRFPSAFEPDVRVQPFTHSNGKRSLVFGFGAKGGLAGRKTDSVTVLSDDLHGAQVVELTLFTGDDGNSQRMILARDPRITSMEAGIEVMREARAKPVAKSRVVNDQGKAWIYTNTLNLLDQFWMPELQAAIMCDYGELIGKTYLRKDKGKSTESWWHICAAQ